MGLLVVYLLGLLLLLFEVGLFLLLGEVLFFVLVDHGSYRLKQLAVILQLEHHPVAAFSVDLPRDLAAVDAHQHLSQHLTVRVDPY